MNVVQQAWEEGGLKRAQDRLKAYIPGPGEMDLRGFEWRYLWKLCRDESKFSFTNFPSAGSHGHVSRWSICRCRQRGVVKLLDFANGRELDTLEVTNATDAISALAFSPADSNLLAVVPERIAIYGILTRGGSRRPSDCRNPAAGLAISRDGKFLATASGHQRTIALWRLSGVTQ